MIGLTRCNMFIDLRLTSFFLNFPVILLTRHNMLTNQVLRQFFRSCRWDRPKSLFSNLTLSCTRSAESSAHLS